MVHTLGSNELNGGTGVLDSLRQSSMEKLTEQSLELSVEDDESMLECENLQDENPLQVASGISNQRDEEMVVLRTPEKPEEQNNDEAR